MPTPARTVFDPSAEGVNAYKLLTVPGGAPRPIAWVSTLDGQGRGNLAPHSFFTVASGRPPVVLFSSLGRKDTVRNIEETGEFVVSFTSEALLAHQRQQRRLRARGRRGRAARDRHRAVADGGPPRVADSPASIECRLERIVEVGHAFVVFGTSPPSRCATTCSRTVTRRCEHLRPVSRLGGDEWGLPPEVLHLTRPQAVEDIR